MSTVNEDIRKLLDELPDDISFEDVQYHVYVRQKVAQGLDDLQQGRVLNRREMERRLAQWAR